MVIFKQDRKPTLAIVKDSTRFSTCITHLTLTKDTKIYRIYKLEDILVEPIACWFTELA